MNKQDLINAVANDTSLAKKDVASVIDAIFTNITDVLTKGGEARFVGFGTFTVTNRAATEGRNPRTGAPIKIPASKQPKFRAGKELKDAVNGRKKS